MKLRPGNARERMEVACKQLLETTQGITTWEWDDHYLAALAVIESPDEEGVLATLAELLPHSWNHLDISEAPQPVRHVSGVWGGLMVDQLMFALEPEADLMLFAIWWPWGNREKSSLRICCTARSETVAKTNPQEQLRTCFGL